MLYYFCMAKHPSKYRQLTLRNDSGSDLVVVSRKIDSVAAWMAAYFQFEVTTLESSQKVQKRDLATFLNFMLEEVGDDKLLNWTPRLSQTFKIWLQRETASTGSRRWHDRTVNRVLAHLKTFSKWVHKHRPFPLGNPMEKIKLLPTASLLSIDRAITGSERRRILDAADLLVEIGGRSRDRHRYRDANQRPQRQDYRPYRNRAVIYALVETGMRRGAVVNIDTDDIDFDKRTIRTREKGGREHGYQISKEGLAAIQSYLEQERSMDADHYKQSPAIFLPATGKVNKDGRLSVNAINEIWNKVCETAGVEGRTPHSARHGMGRHLIEKTGNVAAVQRQLGHQNAAYSLQYTRITDEELNDVLDDRD